MKRKILIAISISVIILTTLLIMNVNTLKKAKIILPSSWLAMEDIGSNIFVNKEMSKEQRQALLQRIPIAKKYVHNVWGELISEPIIYACSTEKCFNNVGGKAREHYYLKHLVLSPHTLTTEQISHQWSHAELAQRLNKPSIMRKIPRWFSEGIAVIVSHEPKYSDTMWQKINNNKLPHPKKEELLSIDDWVKAVAHYQQNINTDEMIVTYATAGHFVRQWYKDAGKTGLLGLITGMKEGKTFYQLYNNPPLSCDDIKPLKNILLANDK